MSGLAWIILDAVLALTAVIGTIKVAVTPPPKPIPAAQLEISEEKAKAAEKPSKEAQKAIVSASHPDALSPRASLDELWKETLFLPGRAEAEPGDTDAEAAAAAAALAGKNFEFELVGIAQISRIGQKSAPVAILRSKQSNARNTQRQRGSIGRGPTRDNSRNVKTVEEPKVAEKLVFKEGDPINATGYLIKAIYPDQKMVEVSRGSETIKLTINFAGEDAVQRRNAVTQAKEKAKQDIAKEEQRQVSIREKQNREAEQREKEEQSKREANPGSPPPPPGAPSSNTATPNERGNDRNANQNSQNSQQLREQVEQRARNSQNSTRRSTGTTAGQRQGK